MEIPPTVPTTMKSSSMYGFVRDAAVAVVIATATLAGTACGDHSSIGSAIAAPHAAASRKASQPLSAGQLAILAQGLLRTTPLAAPITVTKTISNHGGSINISDADFELQIPAGAFSEPSMTISVTALAGNVVAYDFQPHGTVFLQPLTFVQGVKHTTWKELKLKAGMVADVSGAYFSDASQLDISTGLATISELLPASLSIVKSNVTFDIGHFSGYLVAMGHH